MKLKLSRHQRSLAALCSLLLLVGLAWAVMQSFWNRHVQIVTAQSRIRDISDRKRHLILLPGRSSSFASSSSSGLLQAETVDEAPALLESYLRNSIQSHGGIEVTVRVGASMELGITVLRADLSARVPEDEIMKLLHLMEAGSPTVIIDSIRIRHLPPINSSHPGEWLGLTGSVRVFADPSPPVKQQL
ncbi:GspMb/PilO family protein [Microvirga sp. G4-2]|uniref:GspMb/PilO family protein n=1 Tax=Microvirga sp. G4-2 TaxID=3434467 RepID=UPI004044F667